MTTATDNRASQSATNSGAGDNGEGRRLGNFRQNAAEAYESARERTSSAYQAARERAGDAYQSAAQRTSETIETNPIAAVAGGLALGLIAGALLPRTQREEELLGPAGRKITDTAREAARAAKEAGRQQIDELGLSRDGIQQRLGEFTDRAVGAVRSSADAAAGRAAGKNGQ
jgi:ElaB/YqjD/DUF883 family membrane-anchored ribosome-binding protein